MPLVSVSDNGFVFKLNPLQTVEVKHENGEWMIRFDPSPVYYNVSGQDFHWTRNLYHALFPAAHQTPSIDEFCRYLQAHLEKMHPSYFINAQHIPHQAIFGKGNKSGFGVMEKPDFSMGPNAFTSPMEKPDHVLNTKSIEERRSLMTEECSEIIQALQKINRFKARNGHWDNVAALEKECGDYLAALSLMVMSRDINLSSILKAGREKLEKFKKDPSLLMYQDRDLLPHVPLVVDDSSKVLPTPNFYPMHFERPGAELDEIAYATFKIRMPGKKWEIAFTTKDGNVGDWQRLVDIDDAQVKSLSKTTSRSTTKYPPSFDRAVETLVMKRFSRIY